MKLRVLVNERGELIAATSGSIGFPDNLEEELKGANSEPVAFLVPAQGQSIQEVEVPDDLVDVDKTSEFHRYVLETFTR